MDYPYVIVVKDELINTGKPETLFSPRDFEYLLERNMGHDAVVYFRAMTEGLEQENRELEQQLGDTIDDNMDLENEVDALRDAIRRWKARYEQKT